MNKNRSPLDDTRTNEPFREVPVSDLPGFVQTHIDWMLAVAYRILQDRAHAEDAVQAAFLKILEKIHTFEGRSKLTSWMHRIVLNEALMVLRKINRHQEEPIDDLLPVFDGAGCRVEPGVDAIDTPEALLKRSQTHQHIRAAIMKLPDGYRVVLCLRDIEGLSTKEVSDALGISEANVKIRLHRARAALKKLLEPLVKDQML